MQKCMRKCLRKFALQNIRFISNLGLVAACNQIIMPNYQLSVQKNTHTQNNQEENILTLHTFLPIKRNTLNVIAF